MIPAWLIGFLSIQILAAAELPRLNIDSTAITVSGVSSGAYMATQMLVAYPDLFAGAGSVAGGVYWCAEGDKIKAQINCMSQPDLIHANIQIEEARRLASLNEIGPIEKLAQKKFYVFASPRDQIIRSGNSDKLMEFLNAFAPRTNILYEQAPESAHGWPTVNYGADCSRGGVPWLLNCGFDIAGRVLSALHQNLLPRVQSNEKHLKSYSQADYRSADTPLYAEGWIYVPADCEKGARCKLHMALHGCQMNPDFIGSQFAEHSGLNEWAESNDIVVLYPQSAKVPADNPYACWDWFGFTGKDYVTRNGPQMRALRAMIRRVSGI